jgi:hypothetical protein
MNDRPAPTAPSADWLYVRRETREFFQWCATYCEPGCCSLGAFGAPEIVVANAWRELSPEHLCVVRRILRGFVARLRAWPGEILSWSFNARWNSGSEAADWFEPYLAQLDALARDAAAE